MDAAPRHVRIAGDLVDFLLSQGYEDTDIHEVAACMHKHVNVRGRHEEADVAYEASLEEELSWHPSNTN